jgi:hypothetical protein
VETVDEEEMVNQELEDASMDQYHMFPAITDTTNVIPSSIPTSPPPELPPEQPPDPPTSPPRTRTNSNDQELPPVPQVYTAVTTAPNYSPDVTPTAATPRSTSHSTGRTANLTKSIRQLEIWHQRMGHPSPQVLQRTQKVVEGIPHLPNASPIFHCRFCNKAKQHKAARGKAEHNNVYLPGTMFHMDLGFFRGPSNLPSVVNAGAAPENPTLIKSIDGHTSYLSIVDAAMRYLWVFPLRSKHPPIELLDKFLSRYGNNGSQRSISTDPQGQLAKSQMFKHMCDRNGFEYQQT